MSHQPAETHEYTKFSRLVANGQALPLALVKKISKGGCNIYYMLDAFGYVENMHKNEYRKGHGTTLEECRALLREVEVVKDITDLKPLRKKIAELLGVKAKPKKDKVENGKL